MFRRKRIPENVPFHGPTERPIGPYLAFMIFEFWLFIGGVLLLFIAPPVWGGMVLGAAVVLFILAILVGG